MFCFITGFIDSDEGTYCLKYCLDEIDSNFRANGLQPTARQAYDVGSLVLDQMFLDNAELRMVVCGKFTH